MLGMAGKPKKSGFYKLFLKFLEFRVKLLGVRN
jgi:hypothetical protein